MSKKIMVVIVILLGAERYRFYTTKGNGISNEMEYLWGIHIERKFQA